MNECSGTEKVKKLKNIVFITARRGDVNIEVCAILNDTTGCLMSCAWKNPKCRIGLIIGTGTNACYLEVRYIITADPLKKGT
jgi:hexokinase